MFLLLHARHLAEEEPGTVETLDQSDPALRRRCAESFEPRGQDPGFAPSAALSLPHFCLFGLDGVFDFVAK